MNLDKEALDRHITGNYGQDQLHREEEANRPTIEYRVCSARNRATPLFVTRSLESARSWVEAASLDTREREHEPRYVIEQRIITAWELVEPT